MQNAGGYSKQNSYVVVGERKNKGWFTMDRDPTASFISFVNM